MPTGNIRMNYGDSFVLEAKLANDDGTFSPPAEPVAWVTSDENVIAISEVSPNGARAKVTALARTFGGDGSVSATVTFTDANSNSAEYQFTVWQKLSGFSIGEINIVPPVPVLLPNTLEIPPP